MQVHIHPLVTIYINTLIAWAKCFLATYGVYPGLYDLLDTPRHDFLAAQLHLCDSTLPRPLLDQSRGPPTIRSEYVALQPHLATSPPPDRLYVCHTTRPSFNMTVCHATSPSIIPPPPVCLSPHKSVTLSVRPTASPSVIRARPSYESSVNPPITLSMTRQSASPPVSLVKCQSDRPSLSDCLHIILPHLSHHLPPSHRLYDAPISPSACPPPANCLTATTTRPPVRPSSPTIQHTQDSSQSLAVMTGEQSHTNGEQSHKAKKFHRAFTNYDLLLHALDASSIYLCDFRCVAPPKSVEDAHVTCGKCDFGGATLNNPSLGCNYMLPRLCDRIPSITPGAEPPRDDRDSGSARSHSMHIENSSSD